jgi:hypothetical protein
MGPEESGIGEREFRVRGPMRPSGSPMETAVSREMVNACNRQCRALPFASVPMQRARSIPDRRELVKWLKPGVLEDGVVTDSDKGTGQGSVISPHLRKAPERLAERHARHLAGRAQTLQDARKPMHTDPSTI